MLKIDVLLAGVGLRRIDFNFDDIFRRSAFVALLICLVSLSALGQTAVLTQHNDNSRTGQNTAETILNTSNVNVNQFGKLFALPVDGQVYAQPLYVPSITIGGKPHNVVIVATEADSIYAYDADSSAAYLWKASLTDAAHGASAGETPLNSSTTIGCTDLQPQIGITATPVIDSTSKTIYVEAKTTNGSSYFHRLHALDLLTGNEKSPGPIQIAATVTGSGDGSTSGQLVFDSPMMSLHQMARPGLLLMNGTIFIAFASHCDFGPYHGWLFAYDAATFARKSVYVTTPNGGLGGFWSAGAGVAADSTGNIFLSTGNGDFDTTNVPARETGDTVLKLGTTNQILTQLDYFTPQDQGTLQSTDRDLGSGGVLLLPDQPGSAPHILVAAGKEGRIYVVNRDQMTNLNSHYCSGCTNDTEILEESNTNAVGGMFSVPAYWNGSLYFWGSGDVLKSIPVTAGLPDFTHISGSSPSIRFPGATPSISSNGTTAGTGIVWAIDSSQYGSPGPGPGPAVLYAYDASNVASQLWNSTQGTNNSAGNAVKFSTPTISNGKVYVGTSSEVDVYGLLGGGTMPTAATPVISPASESVASPIQVMIVDSTTGAKISYTTDGTTPSPTHGTQYTGAFTLTSSATVKAIASATNFSNSAVATAVYTIGSNSVSINYGSGLSANGLSLSGTAAINGTRLRLTDTGTNEAGSGFFSTPVNVQTFTTDFSFQLTTPNADGITFTIHGGNAAAALGPSGGGLGYGPDTPGGSPGIPTSVAVKFDLYDNTSEGTDSTGVYTNGVSPTIPSFDMTSSGVNLHSGDVFQVHMTYDGTNLSMTVTDVTTGKVFSQTFANINIPGTIGGNTGYVGFTGGTGGQTAIQEIETWTYSSAPVTTPQASTPQITPAAGSYSSSVKVSIMDSTTGATITYTTDGSNPIPGSHGTAIASGGSFTLTSSATVKAIASASGFSASNVASAAYAITLPPPAAAATPQITPVAGSYSGSVTVTITDSTSGATITYTTDGSAPVPGSHGTAIASGGSFTLNSSATVEAIASASGFSNSAVATVAYIVTSPPPPTSINFGSGFAGETTLTLNGGATISGARLRLTDGGATEARSAFNTAPVSVTQFVTDFQFQLTNPNADGITFTIQGVGPTAVGPSGGGLGYGPDSPGSAPGIAKSVAIKFDLYSNAGEGVDSTGSYVNGASPTTPSSDMTSSGVNLHSGDIFQVHVTYNGTTLAWTVTDSTTGKLFSTSANVNIPNTVGGNTAFVGFTGGTGGQTATQEILTWTFGSSATSAAIQFETESPVNFNASTSSGPTYRVFTWAGFKNGSGTTMDGTAAGQFVTITLNVPQAGVYDVRVATKKFNSRGIVQLSVNGTNVGPASDQYSTSEVWQEFDLGNVTLAAGNQQFKFTTIGKNAASSAFTQAFDYIKLNLQ
jgi:hypothetical protein